MILKKAARHEIEGEHLSPMRMSGKLEIKQAGHGAIHHRLVLEKKGEIFSGKF